VRVVFEGGGRGAAAMPRLPRIDAVEPAGICFVATRCLVDFGLSVAMATCVLAAGGGGILLIGIGRARYDFPGVI
jgi:hypothetical protein